MSRALPATVHNYSSSTYLLCFPFNHNNSYLGRYLQRQFDLVGILKFSIKHFFYINFRIFLCCKFIVYITCQFYQNQEVMLV